MTEKEQIEKATAEKFLILYNAKFSTSYVIIKEIYDSPDVRCEDLNGNKLSLEVTLTEDRGGDIQERLGRSNHKDLFFLKEHVRPVQTNSLNVTENAWRAIIKKMNNDYGKNVALVVRDCSPDGWNWDGELDNAFIDIKNPFDRGIWMLTCGNPNKIYQVL